MARTRRTQLQAAVRSLGLPKLEEELAIRGMDSIAPADAEAFLDDVAKVRKLLPALKARRLSRTNLNPALVKGVPKSKSVLGKTKIADFVCERTRLRQSEAAGLVNAVFDSIAEALRGGEEVRLVGFGTFSVAPRAASEGRNPRTGEKIQLSASKQAKFKPGKGLRSSLN